MNNAIKGRMNRATYCATLALVIAIFAVIIAFDKKPPGVMEVLTVFIGVPRLHDFGRSGWWIVSVFLIEIAAIVVGLVFVPMADFGIVAGLTVLLMLIAMIVLGCIKGDEGANAFGEPVKGLFGRGATTSP